MPNMKDLSLKVEKLWPMLKFFDGHADRRTDGRTDGQKDRVITIGHPPRSRLHVQNLWYRLKGLVIRITHAKYESPISYNKEVMANVKVFQK